MSKNQVTNERQSTSIGSSREEQQTQKQTTLCNFETVECEEEQHEKCHETYGNTELDLEAKCICDCHSDKKKEKQPLPCEPRVTALDIGRQSELDDFGLGATNDKHKTE